jgi:hypothetical protein
MAKEYDESENNIPDRITFVNTKLGETYKQKGEVPEWQNLYMRCAKITSIRPVKKSYIHYRRCRCAEQIVWSWKL